MFRRAAALAAPLLFPLAATAAAFDCARATKAPASVICANPMLTGLEKEAARLAGVAAAHMAPASRREFAQSQASYQKTLAACADAEPCLRRTFIEHIHRLRQAYADARTRDGEGISRGPQVVVCPGFDALIAVTFVDSDPAFAFLAWRDKALVLTRTDSPERYVGAFATGEAQFEIRDKQTTLTLPGKPSLACRVEEGG